jgi:hypothetical protein
VRAFEDVVVKKGVLKGETLLLIEDGASNVRTIFKVTHKNNNQSS